MGNSEEEALTSTLIDPESFDNPVPSYQKGEVQESKCRDAWAALLFYAQLIAIACVCGIFGVPAVRKNIIGKQQQDNGGEQMDYSGLIYRELLCGDFYVFSLCRRRNINHPSLSLSLSSLISHTHRRSIVLHPLHNLTLRHDRMPQVLNSAQSTFFTRTFPSHDSSLILFPPIHCRSIWYPILLTVMLLCMLCMEENSICSGEFKYGIDGGQEEWRGVCYIGGDYCSDFCLFGSLDGGNGGCV